MKILAWLIAAVGLVATFFYIQEGLTGAGPMPWLNGFLAGPICALTVVPMLFRVSSALENSGFGGKIPAAYRGAPIGMGTVVALSRTGLSVNDQPQMLITLDVDTQDGRSFRAVAKQMVDLIDMPAVQPGSLLPVRYLPGNDKVVLATDAPPAELQQVLDQIRLAKGLVTPRQLQIAQQGQETQAVVLSMAPTGEIRGNRAVVSLGMRVTRPDGSSFDLVQEKTLSPEMVAHAQPGAVVRVRYLAHDESEVVVLVPAQS
ncbi:MULTISPECIES: hypothetical protein [unclassified Crossiella]|uniref:hypothetical protein n=1 Tax=unclassified Crossiella TaxID=2620835 RepID=UPI001FFF1AE2|nr:MULTISPECIES: hypothetical protein [unclassified Crossiella]MCK2244721.1 hypothetical protein [Crossiella sp. S99.2]MCK2258281.1 hypothetical protein [Crossiella sp. S99.1]